MLKILLRFYFESFKTTQPQFLELRRLEGDHQTRYLVLVLKAFLSLIYRVLLSSEQRVKFEALALFCVKYSDLIPLNFILAFYVAQVVTRWWEQWNVRQNKLYYDGSKELF